MILAAELPEKFVGPLQMLLGDGVDLRFGPGRQWHRWRCGPTTCPTGFEIGLFWWYCSMRAAAASSTSVLTFTKNHLTDHGEGQSVGSGLAIDEPKNRIGGITEIRDQPLT